MVLSVFIPQYENVRVSIPLLPSSNVVYVDGLEVVEVLAVLRSPSVQQLQFLFFAPSVASFLVDESGTEPRGVVSPIPVTESVDPSGYESVSILDPQTFCAAFSECGSGCLLVAVALGLGLVALGVRCPWPVVSSPGPVSFLWGPSHGEARNCPVLRPKRKGTDLKTGSDPKDHFKAHVRQFRWPSKGLATETDSDRARGLASRKECWLVSRRSCMVQNSF